MNTRRRPALGAAAEMVRLTHRQMAARLGWGESTSGRQVPVVLTVLHGSFIGDTAKSSRWTGAVAIDPRIVQTWGAHTVP